MHSGFPQTVSESFELSQEGLSAQVGELRVLLARTVLLLWLLSWMRRRMGRTDLEEA